MSWRRRCTLPVRVIWPLVTLAPEEYSDGTRPQKAPLSSWPEKGRQSHTSACKNRPFQLVLGFTPLLFGHNAAQIGVAEQLAGPACAGARTRARSRPPRRSLVKGLAQIEQASQLLFR
jgi:hypothetical protein